LLVSIDAYGLKIQGGYLKFLPKSRGGSRVSGKIARGSPLILGFIAFLLTSFSKICLGGDVSYLPPPVFSLLVRAVGTNHLI
jgi:hypothetical protein